MTEPHPAFPSVDSPSSSRSALPVLTPSDITKYITQAKPLTGVKQKLIPSFERLVASPNRDAVEEALCQGNVNLEERSDEELANATVPLVYVLTARLNVANSDRRRDNVLLELCARFVRVMDGQYLPFMSARVSLFSWSFLQLAQGCERLEQNMETLYRLSMTTSPHCLTGSLAAYLEACLLTQSYEHALPLIREIYTDVKTGGCGYLDIITFFHHAGLIAAATQDYPLAVELFSIVVQVPTHTASAIQVTAAKRAIICEVLVSGKRLHLPKATAQVVARAVEKNHGVYFKLAKAFEGKDWDAVEKIAEDERKEFEKDCNLGLVQKVLGAVLERKIRKIKTLYSRLTVDALVAKVATSRPQTIEEVVTKLQAMITSGKIQATISDSSPTPIVTFSDDVAAEPQSAVDQLARMNGMASLLREHLHQSGRDIGMNQKYLQKQGTMLDMAGGKGQGSRQEDFASQAWGRAPLASVDHLMME